MGLIPSGSESNEVVGKLIVDGSNGVGGEKLQVYKEDLELNGLVIEVQNTRLEGGVLNEGVGADFVQKEKVIPHMALVHKMTEWFDGSSISDTKLSDDYPCRIGVQTAYANGASTDFLKQQGLEVVFTPTGVKYLHEICSATNNELRLFLKVFVLVSIAGSGQQNAALGLLAISKLINQAVGDALSGMLLVEAILRYMGWSIHRWNELYYDLPSRQLKNIIIGVLPNWMLMFQLLIFQVKLVDKTAVVTANAETEVVKPLGIQEASNAETANYPKGRCFIRPSETENVIHVYAEASLQDEADRLAKSVANLISRIKWIVAIAGEYQRIPCQDMNWLKNHRKSTIHKCIAKADMWAMGAIMAELFTLHPLFSRLNPEKPHLQEYQINLKECGPMVLDALIKIKNEMDPKLMFRCSYWEGICGSCAINIDGCNGLTCLTKIESGADTTITLLLHMFVIKDLVVDMTNFYNRIKSKEPRLKRKNHHFARKGDSPARDRAKLDGIVGLMYGFIDTNNGITAMDEDKVPTDEEQLDHWALPEDDLILHAIVGIKDPCRPGDSSLPYVLEYKSSIDIVSDDLTLPHKLIVRVNDIGWNFLEDGNERGSSVYTPIIAARMENINVGYLFTDRQKNITRFTDFLSSCLGSKGGPETSSCTLRGGQASAILAQGH
ncbi:hypothetical protein FNV43_RR26458 [Rhamnella rubrinervis]|uniref:2Fe-2S ferredoxin-type domain-containing protein n=1 Tax=Rhamnella rubrinervis TaxID=2594499 RepID=A0A8K0DML9_9ROSA|nr:hypothetical protein FNV43_RR26458 [Rhamnella rubrinervis]